MSENTTRAIFSSNEVSSALRTLEAKVGKSGAESLIHHLQFYGVSIDNARYFTVGQIENYLKMIFGDGAALLMHDIRRALDA